MRVNVNVWVNCSMADICTFCRFKFDVIRLNDFKGETKFHNVYLTSLSFYFTYMLVWKSKSVAALTNSYTENSTNIFLQQSVMHTASSSHTPVSLLNTWLWGHRKLDMVGGVQR